ncbi:MAG: response regulator [Candidatus Omnitrophota bacterium]|nr:response regulator [Candidatus Omnitrophota bacterium]MDZ4241646.1 response regulator [Candidatus Omnitrophota bacterium]
MNKNLEKLKQIGGAVTILGYLQAALYALIAVSSWGTLRAVSLELFLYLALLAGAIGTVLRKEWARLLLIFFSAAAFLYHVGGMAWERQGDALTVAFLVLCLVVFGFYQHPLVRAQFVVPKPRTGPGWTILLVDDDKTFVRMVSSDFFRRGVTVLVASSGERGIEMARAQKPDLIVLDVILPGMKGREVCLSLKEDPKTKDIPVIFLTVKDSPDDIHAEFEAGAVSHLTKPVDLKKLYLEIQKILGA